MLKAVDVRCQIQFPFMLVDLALWSFPWISPKLINTGFDPLERCLWRAVGLIHQQHHALRPLNEERFGFSATPIVIETVG